jgi:hypothetical protein
MSLWQWEEIQEVLRESGVENSLPGDKEAVTDGYQGPLNRTLYDILSRRGYS